MAINNGGPAFPVDYDHGTFKPSHVDEAKRLMSGMSLRDYFAAKAMESLISTFRDDYVRQTMIDKAAEKGVSAKRHVANCAYAYADEMIAAREAK